MKIYRTNCNVTIGCKHKFEPAIIAASISPTRNAVKALSNAYIELEQAVSNKYEGPCKPKLYEIRFASKARLQPVILKPPGETLSYIQVFSDSEIEEPTISRQEFTSTLWDIEKLKAVEMLARSIHFANVVCDTAIANRIYLLIYLCPFVTLIDDYLKHSDDYSLQLLLVELACRLVMATVPTLALFSEKGINYLKSDPDV
uniref:Uncharacterized protein n=1 Tax=Glossina pallidipes TaxID=7398 RepID=A0A1B0AA84_GLOPL